MGVDRDDLIAGFWRRAPERVAQATDLWLTIEGGEVAGMRELRRLLHTIKGEAHMLGLLEAGTLLERAEELVGTLMSSGRDPEVAGDALLGAFEALGLLASSQDSHEALDLSDVFAAIAAALQAVNEGATTGDMPAVDEPSHGRAASAVEPDAVSMSQDAAGGAPRGLPAPAEMSLEVDRVQPLFYELRRLHGELQLLLPELAEVRRQFRALITEIRPDVSAELLRERIVKTLGYGTEIERRLTGLRQAWSANEFSTNMALEALQDVIQRASLVSTEELRAQVHRTARSTSKTLHKEITVEVEGVALMDAAIERRLRPCLLHLVRNAVDHGVEPVSVRRSRGKKPKGRIRVAFTQTESSVAAVVEDDGGGIDFDGLRERLAQNEPGALTLTDAEVLDRMFDHGVSVRERAETISGRGVGLDVVTRELSAVGGNVKVESTAGMGTRFVLTLPATLRADVVVPLVSRGQQFAVPSRSVVTVVRVDELVETAQGIHVRIADRDAGLVPIFSLGALTRGEGAPRVGDSAVVVSHRTGLFALTVDAFNNPRPLTFTRTQELAFRSRVVRGVALLADGDALLLLDVDALHQAAVRGTAAAGSKVETRSEPHVLVVEDAPVARELLMGLLRSFGMRVTEAVDGREGLIAALSERPDVILTDLEMPYLHGLQLIARLKEHPGLKSVPVVVLTTRSDSETEARARALGVVAFLSKQRFVEDELRRILDTALGGR